MESFINIEHKHLVFTSKKNIIIEKKYLNLQDDFIDYINTFRLEIKDGGIVTYMTFNLSQKDNKNAIYKSTSILGEQLLIIPIIPKI